MGCLEALGVLAEGDLQLNLLGAQLAHDIFVRLVLERLWHAVVHSRTLPPLLDITQHAAELGGRVPGCYAR